MISSYSSALLTGIIFLFTTTLSAQTKITGKVTDAESGSALSFASVRIKEKALGVVANEQGEFTLSFNSSPDNFTLIISFIGFKTQEIKLTEFIGRKNKIIKLEPVARELETVTISEGKFDLNTFMAEVIKNYQSGSRTTPHIAQAYFQEQVILLKQKPVLFADSKPALFADGIGYSVYLGDVENQAARSNYKFFYEQVSVNRDYTLWTDYIAKLGKTTDHRFGASDNLNNFRSSELNGPLAANGKKFKYKLKQDSTFFYNGLACLYINFKGAGQSGWMLIEEENHQVRVIAFNESENIWSHVYNDRVEGIFWCSYDYHEGQHYLSETGSSYLKGDIYYSNKLKVVSQKFDKLELSEKEYWSINSLDRFTISEAKASDQPFEPYNFSKTDSVQRVGFKGFEVLMIDAEKNPDYGQLLTKLRAFF